MCKNLVSAPGACSLNNQFLISLISTGLSSLQLVCDCLGLYVEDIIQLFHFFFLFCFVFGKSSKQNAAFLSLEGDYMELHL